MSQVLTRAACIATGTLLCLVGSLEPSVVFASQTQVPDSRCLRSADVCRASETLLAESTEYHHRLSADELLQRYEFIEDAEAWYSVLYEERDFSQIEDFVAQSLDKELTDEVASAFLTRFYEVLSHLPTDDDDEYTAADDEQFEQNLAVVDEWIAQSPGSHVPYLVKGKLLRQYGWEIRTNRYGSRVQPEAWPKFYQALVASKVELEKSADLNPKDPNIWAALMNVERDQSRNVENFSAFYFQQGLMANPSHIQLWIAKGWELDPRWGGSYAQLIEFAQSVEQAAIDYDKPMLGFVSLLAYRKIFTRAEAEYLESDRLWETVQGLYERILFAYPNNLRTNFYYAHDAYYANQPQAAAAQFDILGSRWTSATAWDDIEEFNEKRAFTYYEIAYAAFSEGRYDDAKTLALNSADMHPTAYAYVLLASMEGNVYRDLEKTLFYARQALFSEPTDEERAMAQEIIEVAEAYLDNPPQDY